MENRVTDEVKDAIVMWVSSFELGLPVNSFSDLSDGIVIESILMQVSPAHFAAASSDHHAIASDWIMASNHISNLLDSILNYFEEEFKKTMDVGDIHPSSIAKDKDEAGILALVQLVVGAVVMCSNKEAFIKRIFALPRTAQNVLKTLVENVLHALQEYVPNSSPPRRGSSSSSSLKRAQEMVRHMRSEREHLIRDINQLKFLNLELHTKIGGQDSNSNSNGNSSSSNSGDNGLKDASLLPSASGGADKSSSSSNSGGSSGSVSVSVSSDAHAALKLQVEELHRALDQRNIDYNEQEEALAAAKRELAAAAQHGKETAARLVDMEETVDSARETALKLAKAESTILKYQQRLDDFAALKREHKGQQEKLAMYQSMEEQMEAAHGDMETIRQQLEQRKRENKALQSEKSAFAELLMDKEAALEEAQAQLESLQEQGGYKSEDGNEKKKKSDDIVQHGDGDDGDNDAFDIEDVEVEVPAHQDHHHSGNDSGSNEALEALRIKLVEAETALEESHSETERSREERDRLESFSRESIQAFQRKFTATLQTVQDEKEMLEGALERLADRCEFDRETWKREERLLLSALHGLGVEIMNMNVKRHMAFGSSSSSSYSDSVKTPEGEAAVGAPFSSLLSSNQLRQQQALESLGR
jgi:hypothetical protein